MDFRNAVIEAVDKLVASGAVEKCIEETLQKTVATVINEALKSYGDFGKELTEKVKASFALNGELDLPSYNETILKIIRDQVEGHTNAVIQQQVAKRMEELLQPPPAEIKLSALVEQFIERLKEQEREGCVCYGEGHRIKFEVTDSEYGHKHIVLAEDPAAKRYQEDIDIGVDREGRVYALRFKDRAVEKEMFAGPFYGFEKRLFQMKAAGSRVIFDCDPAGIETTWELSEA